MAWLSMIMDRHAPVTYSPPGLSLALFTKVTDLLENSRIFALSKKYKEILYSHKWKRCCCSSTAVFKLLLNHLFSLWGITVMGNYRLCCLLCRLSHYLTYTCWHSSNVQSIVFKTVFSSFLSLCCLMVWDMTNFTCKCTNWKSHYPLIKC